MKATDKIRLLIEGKATLKQIAELEAQEAKELEAEQKAEATPPIEEKKEETKEEPKPDFEKLYNESKAKLDEVSKTLAEIQKENRSKDTGFTIPDPEDEFLKLFD